ncbi:MAG: AMP-binding protein, partial [Inhella sp.]
VVAALFCPRGTPAHPRGVGNTPRSMWVRVRAAPRFDQLVAEDEVLAYMPLAWIGQNIFSFSQWLTVGYVVNCPESPATVAIDLKEVGPSYYFAPPRIFEGLLTSVTIRMEDASAPKRWLYARCMDWARAIGPRRMAGAALSFSEQLRYAIGDLLVYAPLRNALGLSRVRVAYTAGEAIGPDLFSFFRAIGVNLKQLYGSTETAVFVCLQPDHEVKADTVGVPIEGVEIRVDEAGELWVRSPGLLKGYYKNPEATAEVLSADGWYRTGDAGFLDAGGHLKIIDRAKDVGRLADGSLFAPKYVENKLKFFPYIKEAVAVGDGRDKVCAMLNIDFEAVGNWAERRGLPYAGYVDLAGKPEVLEMMRGCVEQVNADLARDERLAGCQIARFLVLHKELDADDGELTRTRKVRRGAIAEKYGVLIDALYGGLALQHIETQVRFEDGRTGVVAADLRIVDSQRFPVARTAA